MITLTEEQFLTISRLADFANWYIEAQDPTGEQYFLDLEDICKGQRTIWDVKQTARGAK